MNKKWITVLVLIVAVVGTYMYKNKDAAKVEESNGAPLAKSAPYEWKLTETEADKDGINHTTVSIVVNGTPRVIGTYPGSCHEVAAGEKGVMSELADPGEVSRVQCWFAGGGNEIGVFEDSNKRVVKVGELGEGDAETAGFRGNFKEVLDLNQ